MPNTDQLMLTEDEIEKNPAIDPKIVNEALQMRRELEQMGVWENRGSRVSSSFETTPALKPNGKSRIRFITQNL